MSVEKRKLAVAATLAGIDIGSVGVILIVIGAARLAFRLWLTATRRCSAYRSM
jgi:hypothetical protein